MENCSAYRLSQGMANGDVAVQQLLPSLEMVNNAGHSESGDGFPLDLRGGCTDDFAANGQY
jgi:hypothetical protein